MKKDSKLCNFRLTSPTVEILERLAGAWECSQTEAVTRSLMIAEAAINEAVPAVALGSVAEQVGGGILGASDRHSIAESAMRDAESKLPSPAPTPRRAESVAQRRAREAKEHAEKLAEADVTARMTGRDDIEYDLENVPHTSALHVALQKHSPVKHSYEVQPRAAKPLTRPHGSTEAKRRREQT